MHLVAVYCPHQLPIRKEIYTYVSQLVTDARADKEQLLIAGDFNAVMQKEDRASGNNKSADTLHKEFITVNGLTPLDTPLQGTARSFTYRKGVEQTPFSRLDDILTLQPLLHTHTETISMAGTNLDHDVLVAQIEYAQLGLLPPLTPTTTSHPVTKLKTPMVAADTRALKHTLASTQAHQWGALLSTTDQIVESQVRPHWNTLETSHQNATTPQPLTHINHTTARDAVNTLGN
jgi:hypothetical protein